MVPIVSGDKCKNIHKLMAKKPQTAENPLILFGYPLE